MKKDCGFMTRKEVKEYLGISENTFRRHFAVKLQGYKIGNRIKYKKKDIEDFLEKV